MAKAEIRHTYDCDPETFWRDILLDQEFNRRLYVEHLGFEQWEVVEQEETDDHIRRVVLVKPVSRELPKALVKVVGDNLGYREEGRLDKKEDRYRFSVIPNRLPDKLTIVGDMRVESRGTGCERVLDLEVVAKVFGLGSMLEKRILSDTRESFEVGVAFAKRERR